MFSAKQTVQQPGYGLRDRCPEMIHSYKRCMLHHEKPVPGCKPILEDFFECTRKKKQNEYDYKVEQALARQRQKFILEVEQEYERVFKKK